MRFDFSYPTGQRGKHLVADAEIVFDDPDADGMWAGLKLVGFAIMTTRDGGRFVSLPSRSYQVRGERRYFRLLRPIQEDNKKASQPLQDLIYDAFSTWEAEQKGGASDSAPPATRQPEAGPQEGPPQHDDDDIPF